MASFYLKFKNLLNAEKDAIMTLKSVSGRSHATLSVDLGHVHSNAAGQPPCHPRNGPARVWWRERQAEARRIAAEAARAEAEKAIDVSVNTLEVKRQKKTFSENGEVSENVEQELERNTEASEKVVTGQVRDELCSDPEYNAILPEPTDTEMYEFECWDP